MKIIVIICAIFLNSYCNAQETGSVLFGKIEHITDSMALIFKELGYPVKSIYDENKKTFYHIVVWDVYISNDLYLDTTGNKQVIKRIPKGK